MSANEWGETALSVTVVHASKVWPADLTPDQIKERVLVEVRTGGAVTFHGGNALAQKDKLIALLKAAAATL